MIIFSLYSVTLPILEKNSQKKKDFPDESFLHKKINNKDFSVGYSATEHIPEEACNLRQYEDLTALKGSR